MNTLLQVLDTISNKEGTMSGRVIGAVYNMHGVLAVSMAEIGNTMFYCLKHEDFFPFKESCPKCLEAENEKVQNIGVQR